MVTETTTVLIAVKLQQYMATINLTFHTCYNGVPVGIRVGWKHRGHIFRFYTVILEFLESHVRAGIVYVIPTNSIYENEQHFFRIRANVGESLRFKEVEEKEERGEKHTREKHCATSEGESVREQPRVVDWRV